MQWVGPRVMRYHVVFNPNSGTALAMGLTPERLQSLFDANGYQARIDASADPMADKIARAANSTANVVIAAGGDGTMTALAAGLLGTGKVLAVLPLGTANLLARDLHVPLQIEAWIATLKDMQVLPIDVAEVNGEIFLHKVVIGLIPALAAGREKLRGRRSLAAAIGYVRYFVRRLARARRLAVHIDLGDGQTRVERVQSIAVSSNAYDEGLGRFFARDRLDRGELSLYILKHLTVFDVFRLTARMLAGRWREDASIGIESVHAVTIQSKKARLQVMIDGEVRSLATPMAFSIRPGALPVLTLPVPDAAPPETPLELEA